MQASQQLGSATTSIGRQTLPSILATNDLSHDLGTLQIDMNRSLSWEGAGFRAEKIKALDRSIALRLAATAKTIKDATEASRDDAAKNQLVKIGVEYAKYRAAAAEVIDQKSEGLGAAASYMLQLDDA